ncbi:vanadium chloroperoxidase [Physcia stellaris]|nr:vanadium chloroperoxidase [Physcia stellaris]
MASTLFTSFIALLTALLLTVNAQSCYFPNGTDANRLNPSNPQYRPCNAGDPVSMCCHIGDECRSDGLCLSTWFDNNIWRDFCTDKTWQDRACIKLCVTGTMARSYANNPLQRADTSVTVTPCGDGSYCCGNGTKAANCCDRNNGLFIDKAGNAVRTDPSAASSHASASSSETASKTLPPVVASVTVTPSPIPGKKENTGVIAVVVVAVLVVLAAVGIGAFFLLRKRRRARRAGGTISYEGKKYSEMPNGEAGGGGDSLAEGRRDVSGARIQGDAELDGDQRYEIQDHTAARERGPVIRHELGASWGWLLDWI